MNSELGNFVEDSMYHVLPDELVVIGRTRDLAIQSCE